jgi:hypothetical protein
MSLSTGQKIPFSYQGMTAYAGQSLSGNAVAYGDLTIKDGSGSGIYVNVTMYYDPNAKGILGATTGVYYIVAGDHTFVNAINSYLQYDGEFTITNVINTDTNPNGKTITEDVSFTAETVAKDTVVFIESGLPSGTLWSVTLNGQTQSSNTDKITFSGLSSGTYSFSVSATGYTANPSSGTVTVP